MSCKKNYSANITTTLAAGSVASPFLLQVNISQKLCKPACVDSIPVFAPQFSLVGYSPVSTGGYVATIRVEGTISYVPCDGSVCCTRTQVVSQEFTFPFASATAPTTVTIVQGVSVNSIAQSGCQTCSRNFVSETPLTLTVA